MAADGDDRWQLRLPARIRLTAAVADDVSVEVPCVLLNET